VSRARILTAVALGAAALLLYAARLEHTPAYLHDAEVLFGLQAHAIATTAHDLSGRLLPLYFQMRPIGDNVWFHPVIVYVTAALLQIAPFAEWSVRLPSAMVGAANVVLVYLVGLRIFGRDRVAIAAALLLLLTPAHFIHSRIAMDYIYPLPFVLGWMLALACFLERGRPWMLFAATSLLGLGVYSYIASVVMMPLYLLMTLAALYAEREGCGRAFLRSERLALRSALPRSAEASRSVPHEGSSRASLRSEREGFSRAPGFSRASLVRSEREGFSRAAGFSRASLAHSEREGFSRAAGFSRASLVAIAGFAWPLVLIPLWLWSHPLVVAETLSRYHIGATPTRYSGLAGRLSMFWYFHDPTYLFLTGGYANVVNSTRHAGVFALPLVLLLPAGIYAIAGRARRAEALAGLVGAGDFSPRSTMRAVALAGFVTAPVAACLAVPEPYAIDRELTVVVFGVLVAACGLEWLLQSGSPARRIAIGALALVPIHFALFTYDYFTDYRRHSAIWFELNHRGAFEALLDRESRSPAPRIYLPRDKDPYMDSYWRFTLTKHGRLALRDKTELYSAADLAPQSIAPGSLVVARLSEPIAATLAGSGLRTIATIPEIGDPPEFVVLER
jgi:4-amino-4-deoxy-L-arabinose transferase-like glycosyltransferase